MSTTAEALTPVVLRDYKPFSRLAFQRGQEAYRPLRRQLLHEDCSGFTDLARRISLLLKMTAAFNTATELDRMRNALAQRYDLGLVHQPYVACLNYRRRFDDAVAYCEHLCQAEPDQADHKLMLINQYLIAGFPHKAIAQIKEYLPAVTNRRQATTLLDILIEAGEIGWLRDQHPTLADAHPRAARESQLSGDHSDIPIYCISMPADHRRLATTRYFTDHTGRFRVIEGIAGRILPDAVKSGLTRGHFRNITDSEIGCSLSHLKAWETIAHDLRENDYALIIEDDARFIFGAAKGLGDMANVAREAKAELIFINRRSCGATIKNRGAEGMQLANVDAALQHNPQDWKPMNPGWGADGYLVTGAMARRLVAIWNRIGILGAADWQMNMICYSQLQPWHDKRALKSIFRALDSSPDRPLVAGFTTNMPLIDTRDHGFSSIDAG